MTLTIEAKMGWNPNSPTNEVRIGLLAYLRIRLRMLDGAEQTDPDPKRQTEIAMLERYIAWLNGDTLEVPA